MIGCDPAFSETRYPETPYPTPHGRFSLLGPSWAAEGGEGADPLIERYGNGVINTL